MMSWDASALVPLRLRNVALREGFDVPAID
jgi:hypothetical protein